MSAILETVESGLRKQQHSGYMNVIESLLAVQTPSQFLKWTRGELQSLFPHEMFVAGIGRINADGIQIAHMLSGGFPVEHIQEIRGADGDVSSPIMARWCKEQKPQLFEDAPNRTNYPATWLASVRKYQLGNIAAHGLRDLNSNVASYFNFSRIPGKLAPTHAYLLTLLVPHMHVTLVKVLRQAKVSSKIATQNTQRISPRECEILHWIELGKTSWEIAQILNITEKTVRNHVQHALIKLRVKNRAQAVAKAKHLNVWDAKEASIFIAKKPEKS